MNQIIFIRWGEAFYTDEQFYDYLEKRSYDPREKKKSWRDWIAWALSESFEVFEPAMPCKQRADYKAWKIWFEKLFPYLGDKQIVLIWSSLWGLFLTKYLSENDFPKNISQLHLVAPVFNDEWLVDEYIWNFSLDTELLQSIENKSDRIFFYFSKDDPSIPFAQCEYYKKIFKKSDFLIFEDRGHFNQPALPELLENINNHL